MAAAEPTDTPEEQEYLRTIKTHREHALLWPCATRIIRRGIKSRLEELRIPVCGIKVHLGYTKGHIRKINSQNAEVSQHTRP
jgi:hypothetical protein